MTDTKKLLIPVVVIILAALVLFGVSAALKTTTANAEAELTDTLVGIMLPGGGDYTAEDVEDSSGIVRVFRGEGGAVVEMYVSGFMSQLHMLVGVQNDGTVTSVSIPESHETYGLGQNARGDWYFLASLIKSTGDLTVADTDAVTGATITSSAVVNAVNSASKYIAGSNEGGASADGVLTGTANGFGGPITVEVTMDGDDITSVVIVSNSETPSVAGAALEQIPAAIAEADSPEVDIVAGATYTSDGIINAVRDALSKAGGSGGATDGGLVGTADGFGGPITVEVTMDGDTITGVTVLENSETLSVASGALEQIPQEIVAANSTDVDIVAGATYTSNGIINAVKDAIGAA